MAPDTPTEAAPEASTRRQTLAAHVTRARGWCLERAADEVGESVSLRLGDRTVCLTDAEFNGLVSAARVETESTVPGEIATLETLALLTKSFEDLATLRTTQESSSSSLYALQAELMLDSALGTALLADTRVCINELLAQGERQRAEPLARLRQRLREAMTEVGQTIAVPERQRAEALAESFTERGSAVGMSCEIDFDSPEPSQAPDCRLSPPPEPRMELSATTFLGAGCLLAFLLWLGLFAVPELGGPEFESLAVGDFDSGDVLSRVDARPPSLFIRVDGAAWNGLDDEGRRRILEDAAVVLERSGYTGALFETEQGVAVAQWLAQNGPTLLEEREPVSF